MTATPATSPRAGAALLLSAFVVATCGLVYELLAGTLASYLLGDRLTQISTGLGTSRRACVPKRSACRVVDRSLGVGAGRRFGAR